MTNAITVNFYGSDLYIVSHNGEAYTPMKPIVEGMGLDWMGQYTKLKQRFAKGIEEIAIPTPGGNQMMICLALRKLSAWLTTIHANKVKASIRNKVIQYQEECDDVLYRYWTDGVVVNPRKKSVMQELNEQCGSYKRDKAIASIFGTGLNEWKSVKAAHVKNIERLINDAQRLLDLS